MIKMKSMKSETVPANRGNGFHNTTFLLGVNYWPRKSGVRMWRNFEESEIDTEFAQIHEMGCDTVRIFPLWDDFQPIYELPGALNQPRGIGMRHDWNMTPGRNPEMIDPEMLRRFDLVLECASRHHLKLIVALLTAWMSGTLFNPTWRGGRNLFQDSFMLKYQMLRCRASVQRDAGRPEILDAAGTLPPGTAGDTIQPLPEAVELRFSRSLPGGRNSGQSILRCPVSTTRFHQRA